MIHNGQFNFPRNALTFLILLSITACRCVPTQAAQITLTDSQDANNFILFDGKNMVPICVETNANSAVARAAKDLAEDFFKVTGKKPEIKNQISENHETTVIIGTLGQSAMIDRLAAEKKLATNGVGGAWESCVMQVVPDPFPNLKRALVIAGSDRRGTIYGIYQLSEIIGVSPWYWWADVPIRRKKTLALGGDVFKEDPPGVKYRGIFINDEDWGLNLWAAKTFDPEFKNIGPKTYEKVFELLLRLRLNYLWPAMHACSTAFGDVPENAALADKFGIVVGSSHCEPMLYNNIKWNGLHKGPWNYSVNRDGIHGIWEETAKTRGLYEAVWTLGIRGIHDAGMETPPYDMPGRINLMGEVFRDQRELLSRYVTNEWGPVAQCFVPYKEVLPIYDAGLKVPDDVTLVWVDDNFGYLRRLSNPNERRRSGGAGVYWHMSYYGGPHSYTWINTTAPALMWEELHKAWENDARNLWVVNVGDLKPAEIGIDYFSHLAWQPDGFPLGGQRQFLNDFALEKFGEKLAPRMTDLLMDFYRLGTVRKPELMERKWALSLTPERARQLEDDYQNLLDHEQSLASAVPANARDAYTELVGFPTRVLAESGRIFMADRKIQQGEDVSVNEAKIASLRSDLESQVQNYNTNLAGGKWNHMMPGLVTGRNLMAWSSQVRWPWGESVGQSTNRPAIAASPAEERNWRAAATADRRTASGSARWSDVEGLGPTGKAVALQPANLAASWLADNTSAPTLEFDFTSKGGDAEVFVDFLPTFRLYPGLKLRVFVSVDDGAPTLIEVPGSGGMQDENGDIRSSGVQNNYTRARIPLPNLIAGKHTFKIRAVDPGAVIDQLSLPCQKSPTATAPVAR